MVFLIASNPASSTPRLLDSGGLTREESWTSPRPSERARHVRIAGMLFFFVFLASGKRPLQLTRDHRRKKTRCSGEKPVCSFCLRLGQPCQYSSGTGSARTPAQTVERNASWMQAGPGPGPNTTVWMRLIPASCVLLLLIRYSQIWPREWPFWSRDSVLIVLGRCRRTYTPCILSAFFPQTIFAMGSADGPCCLEGSRPAAV